MAEHALLARPAAVKLISTELLEGDAEGVVERFDREAQATALLTSPHTVRLFDFGRAPDGTFYYVMELLDGLSLLQVVGRRGPLPAARVVHVLLGVCHSLAEAHARELVHRDIKPANLFLCRVGQDVDVPKVLDFGLVTSSGPADSDGVIAGTPAFMPPEQARSGVTVDGRADIYSLGCVAYWLLTGAAPYDAPTITGMLAAHAGSPVPRASALAEEPVPKALDDLIVECMGKTPADRPAGVDLLRQRLGVIAEEHPWTAEDARRWWDLNHPGGLIDPEPGSTAGASR